MPSEGRNCSGRFSLHFRCFCLVLWQRRLKTGVSGKVCIFSPCSWILKTKYELESQEQALSILWRKLLLKIPFEGRNCSGRFSLHFWLFLPCSSAAAVKTVGPFVAIWLKPPHLNHTALITGHLETASDALPIFWSQLKSIVSHLLAQLSPSHTPE